MYVRGEKYMIKNGVYPKKKHSEITKSFTVASSDEKEYSTTKPTRQTSPTI
jgi:hypothetical protein